jgi:tRNA(fMet)-specific endonuclease VapC
MDVHDRLKTMRLNIDGMDLKIAAIVLAAGGVLVTRNRQDFQRVPDLVLQNWAE